MKIIDLLNKIANGEEVPFEIKLFGVTFYFNNEKQCYFSKYDKYNILDMHSHCLKNKGKLLLNEEVEIKEKENKFTKEDFIKEIMDLEGLTREEFNKIYEVKECNCGRGFCKGFIKVEKVEEEKKIPEKLGITYMKKIDDDAFISERFSQAEQKIIDTLNDVIDYLKSKGE